MAGKKAVTKTGVTTWWRGAKSLAGKVTINGAPLTTDAYLYDDSIGRYLKQTSSDASGNWSFGSLAGLPMKFAVRIKAPDGNTDFWFVNLTAGP
jgi:hypothetical protein